MHIQLELARWTNIPFLCLKKKRQKMEISREIKSAEREVHLRP